MSWIVHHTDCISYLRSLKDKSVDVVFADPPYGVGMDYDGYEDTRENLIRLVNVFMPEALRVARRVAITPGNSNQWLYPEPTWTLAFVNPAGVGRSAWGFSCWQPILVYGKDPYLSNGMGARPDVFIMKHSGDIDNDVDHPCPKPNNVMRWIVERVSLPGETILDPFMGTGTTGAAAVTLKRNFIGVDQSEKYVSIARAKIAAAERAPAMF